MKIDIICTMEKAGWTRDSGKLFVRPRLSKLKLNSRENCEICISRDLDTEWQIDSKHTAIPTDGLFWGAVRGGVWVCDLRLRDTMVEGRTGVEISFCPHCVASRCPSGVHSWLITEGERGMRGMRANDTAGEWLYLTEGELRWWKGGFRG